MSIISSRFLRDANGVPIKNSYDHIITKITRAFTGAAGLGAVGTTTLFTVTGFILARTIGVCTEDLASAGGGTIQIGCTSTAGAASSLSAFIAATTATAIDNGEVWMGTTPINADLLSNGPRIIGAGNIIETIATGDITDGTVDVYLLWAPFSSDGNCVAAV